MELLIDRTFAWLLRASWQVSLVILLVIALQRLLRRHLSPRWRHTLWLLVVCRMVLPASLETPLSLFNVFALPGPVRLVAAAAGSDGKRTASGSRATPHTAGAAHETVLGRSQPDAVDRHGPIAVPSLTWRSCLVLVWLAIATALLARAAIESLRLRHRLRGVPATTEPRLLHLLEECRCLIGTTTHLPLMEVNHAQSPALWGLWRPRLLLPVGLAQRLSDQELRFILLHELAHLKRRDIALNWLTTALLALHWFNPLVWLAFRRMQADGELACDAVALACLQPSQRKSYGRTLLKLLEQCGRPAAWPAAAGIVADTGSIQERIGMIARFRRPGWWSALVAVPFAALAVVCLTDAKTPAKAPSAALSLGPPANATARDARLTGESRRLNELRQLAWAVIFCADANGGVLPKDLEQARPHLPAAMGRINLAGYRVLVSGRVQEITSDRSRTPLLIASPEDEPGKSYLAFLDGRVEIQREEPEVAVLREFGGQAEYVPGSLGRLRVARLKVLQRLAAAVLQHAAENGGNLPPDLDTVSTRVPSLQALSFRGYRLLITGNLTRYAAHRERIPLIVDLQTDEPDMVYLAYLDGHAEVSKKLKQLARSGGAKR